MATTVPDLIELAVHALETLGATAEPVEDEQQYIQDLLIVWSARLRAIGGARSAEAVTPELANAFEGLGAEAERVVDPHRAIDWLSTLPQVALIALGEPLG
jgi:hypothetical protein